jgi:hypothetical protein
VVVVVVDIGTESILTLVVVVVVVLLLERLQLIQDYLGLSQLGQEELSLMECHKPADVTELILQ